MIMLPLLVDEFVRCEQGRALSPSTVKRERIYLRRFLSWVGERDIRDFTYQDISEFQKYLKTLVSLRGKPLKSSSIACEMTTNRQFFLWLHNSGHILTDPYDKLPETIKAKKKSHPIFTKADINAFLDSIPIDDAIGLRDRAMFELMYSSGLRSGEARSLVLEHLNLDERVCLVIGKGKKDRFVPFSHTAELFLVKYLKNARSDLKKRLLVPLKKEYVFLSLKGMISSKVLRTQFKTYLEEAGIDDRGYVPHSIRHSTATHLLENGANIRYVSELLGHESLKTTQIYTRPGEENIKRIYRMYHPRENDYYLEVNEEYLSALEQLKADILYWKEEKRKQREKMDEKR